MSACERPASATADEASRPTALVLVRHGAVDDGDLSRPFPLVDGRGDPPLSPLGWEQARLLAERLAAARPQALYVSGLRRTYETARPLADRLGLEPITDPDLAELHLGEWEAGRYRHHLAADDRRAVLAFVHGRWEAIPGAESLGDLSRRTFGALERIAQAHSGQVVVTFTHRIVIDVLLARLQPHGASSFAVVDHTSVTTLLTREGRWRLLRFNDTSHLLDPRRKASVEPPRPPAPGRRESEQIP